MCVTITDRLEKTEIIWEKDKAASHGFQGSRLSEKQIERQHNLSIIVADQELYCKRDW